MLDAPDYKENTHSMLTVERVIIAILGVAALMVIHEAGHLLAARAFGLRVVRFSIGFGPSVWKHKPKGSDTVYQIALIPFLAYVQVAGMNPFEENDPEDKGSYANASLTARISTVVGGPLANYLFASVIYFGALMAFGKPVVPDIDTLEPVMKVMPDGAASKAGMKDGDRIIGIEGKALTNFKQVRDAVVPNAEKQLAFKVLRDGKEVELEITPARKTDDEGNEIGLVGVTPLTERTFESISMAGAVSEAVAMPALVVRNLVVGLATMIRKRVTPDVSGPLGIVKEVARAAELGPFDTLRLLAALSAYLGGFNLLPVPALDGGRLMFLGYELVARRKPNAKMEAQIHAVGLLLFLALIAVVTIGDIQK